MNEPTGYDYISMPMQYMNMPTGYDTLFTRSNGRSQRRGGGQESAQAQLRRWRPHHRAR